MHITNAIIAFVAAAIVTLVALSGSYYLLRLPAAASHANHLDIPL
ncbi:MAG TPA: hypothetical protein VGJ20_15285 [Xanthobacteraceae bacterium]|jgi:hypothetical protein